MKKLDELKKSDIEILEEIYRRLVENNKKTEIIVEQLKQEVNTESTNENL